MRPDNEIKFFFVQDLTDHVRTEGHRNAPIVGPEAGALWHWISPEEITQEAGVRYVCRPPQRIDQGVDVVTHHLLRKATVHTDDLVVNSCTYWQAIEDIDESFPHLDVVASLALIVEAIDSANRGRLMVSPQEEKVLRVLDLVRKKQANRLQRLLAPINIIAQEQIVCLWWETCMVEDPQQVVELAMDISAELQWNLQI